jgi:hypothetical protein
MAAHGKSLLEHVTCSLDIARNGDVDLYLSTTFKQFTRLAFEMRAYKG